jgi:phosphoadenosine phosphosulfate reductase
VFEAVGPRIRINPLARWTTADLAELHARTRNCARTRWSPMAICRSAASPARSRCKPGEDARSGRWAGQAKTECGIHLSGLDQSLTDSSL